MNRKLIAFTSLIALAGTFAPSAAAADADAEAGAVIVAPLQVTKAEDLYFGTIVASLTSADTVVVGTDGSKTCGAALTCLTNDHTAAQFNVAGQVDESYTISLPSSVTISSGANNMTIDNFAGSQTLGTLTAGADSFTVGGTLNVATNQAAGNYTGTFTVTVEYQ